MSFNSLISFWRSYVDVAKGFRVHPQDRPIFEKLRMLKKEDLADDFKSYLAGPRYGSGKDQRFHFSHRPLPYIGDLKRAKVILLQLNPGFAIQDYLAEFSDNKSLTEQYGRAWKSNIQQSFASANHPFFFLDPAMCWHSGYRYWFNKLEKVILELERYPRFKNASFVERQAAVAKSIAVIELVAYRSSSFRYDSLLRSNGLPSTLMARAAVNHLLEKQKGQRPLVVLMRSEKKWKLDRGADIQVTSRSASINSSSDRIAKLLAS